MAYKYNMQGTRSTDDYMIFRLFRMLLTTLLALHHIHIHIYLNTWYTAKYMQWTSSYKEAINDEYSLHPQSELLSKDCPTSGWRTTKYVTNINAWLSHCQECESPRREKQVICLITNWNTVRWCRNCNEDTIDNPLRQIGGLNQKTSRFWFQTRHPW